MPERLCRREALAAAHSREFRCCQSSAPCLIARRSASLSCRRRAFTVFSCAPALRNFAGTTRGLRGLSRGFMMISPCLFKMWHSGKISRIRTQSPDSLRRSGLWRLLLPGEDGLRHALLQPESSRTRFPCIVEVWIVISGICAAKSRYWVCHAVKSGACRAAGHGRTGTLVG